MPSQRTQGNKDSCPSRNCCLIVKVQAQRNHMQKQAKQNLSSGSADQIRHHLYPKELTKKSYIAKQPHNTSNKHIDQHLTKWQ